MWLCRTRMLFTRRRLRNVMFKYHMSRKRLAIFDSISRRISIVSCSRYCLLCEFMFQTEERVTSSRSPPGCLRPQITIPRRDACLWDLNPVVPFFFNCLGHRNELNYAPKLDSSPLLSASTRHVTCRPSHQEIRQSWEPRGST